MFVSYDLDIAKASGHVDTLSGREHHRADTPTQSASDIEGPVTLVANFLPE